MKTQKRAPRPETDREAAIWEDARNFGRINKKLDGGVLGGAIFAMMFLGLCWLSVNHTRNPYTEVSTELGEIPPALFGPSSPIRAIPDGRGNFRSGSLTGDQLRRALATGRIRFVLRMNGDDSKDQGSLSTNEERAIVEEAGATYVTSTLTLNRFDAHAGYREGRGYIGALKNAITYLRQGGVLIHCRHGHDRTGAIVGGWLAANGLDYDLIIAHNNWHGYAKKGGGYLRYLETVEGQLEKSSK